MEEIKRYLEQLKCDNEPIADFWVSMDEYKYGEWVKYSDHKAVVETMQNKIDELEKVNKSLECCGNCKYYKLDRVITCLRPQKTLCIKWYPSEPGAVNLWIAKGIK